MFETLSHSRKLLSSFATQQMKLWDGLQLAVPCVRQITSNVKPSTTLPRSGGLHSLCYQCRWSDFGAWRILDHPSLWLRDTTRYQHWCRINSWLQVGPLHTYTGDTKRQHIAGLTVVCSYTDIDCTTLHNTTTRMQFPLTYFYTVLLARNLS